VIVEDGLYILIFFPSFLILLFILLHYALVMFCGLPQFSLTEIRQIAVFLLFSPPPELFVRLLLALNGFGFLPQLLNQLLVLVLEMMAVVLLLLLAQHFLRVGELIGVGLELIGLVELLSLQNL
jgi:hypothetical protein